jgi:hypothetical protein
MSADDLASKLSQSGIPQSNRSTIINSKAKVVLIIVKQQEILQLLL